MVALRSRQLRWASQPHRNLHSFSDGRCFSVALPSTEGTNTKSRRAIPQLDFATPDADSNGDAATFRPASVLASQTCVGTRPPNFSLSRCTTHVHRCWPPSCVWVIGRRFSELRFAKRKLFVSLGFKSQLSRCATHVHRCWPPSCGGYSAADLQNSALLEIQCASMELPSLS